jgi:hypothetical protein
VAPNIISFFLLFYTTTYVTSESYNTE